MARTQKCTDNDFFSPPVNNGSSSHNNFACMLKASQDILFYYFSKMGSFSDFNLCCVISILEDIHEKHS